MFAFRFNEASQDRRRSSPTIAGKNGRACSGMPTACLRLQERYRQGYAAPGEIGAIPSKYMPANGFRFSVVAHIGSDNDCRPKVNSFAESCRKQAAGIGHRRRRLGRSRESSAIHDPNDQAAVAKLARIQTLTEPKNQPFDYE
jgi:hypothetical protein